MGAWLGETGCTLRCQACEVGSKREVEGAALFACLIYKFMQAEEIVRKRLEVVPSPEMWCLLGDVTHDIQVKILPHIRLFVRCLESPRFGISDPAHID